MALNKRVIGLAFLPLSKVALLARGSTPRTKSGNRKSHEEAIVRSSGGDRKQVQNSNCL
jgi:hypothetical protein